MKAYKQIQDTFKRLDQSTKSWHKMARVPISEETVNAILYRDATVSAAALVYLAHALGISNKDIIDMVDQYAKEVPRKALEVSTLKKLIAPVDLIGAEQNLIARLRTLDEGKRQLVFNMVEELRT